MQRLKIIVGTSLIALALLFEGNSSSASVTEVKGTSCLAVGQRMISTGLLYTCMKSGKSKKWSGGVACPAINSKLNVGGKTYVCAVFNGNKLWRNYVTLTPTSITFAVDPTYSPNEFRDEGGYPVGWEVELGNAVAIKLGITAKFKIVTFDKILSGVSSGKYDAGLSSLSDTSEREKQVDFINYYLAGIQWVTAVGNSVNPQNACGLTVAIEAGTYEIYDLDNRSKACLRAGKAKIVKLAFDDLDSAIQAVLEGKADALTTESPVAGYAVKANNEALKLAGKPYDLSLYGIAVSKKNSSLTNSIKRALSELISDGTYGNILESWGVSSGAVTKVTINAG